MMMTAQRAVMARALSTSSAHAGTFIAIIAITWLVGSRSREQPRPVSVDAVLVAFASRSPPSTTTTTTTHPPTTPSLPPTHVHAHIPADLPILGVGSNVIDRFFKVRPRITHRGAPTRHHPKSVLKCEACFLPSVACARLPPRRPHPVAGQGAAKARGKGVLCEPDEHHRRKRCWRGHAQPSLVGFAAVSPHRRYVFARG